jgi:hypothetical protein
MEPGVLSPDGTGAFASPREYEKCQSRLVTKSGHKIFVWSQNLGHKIWPQNFGHKTFTLSSGQSSILQARSLTGLRIFVC